MDKNGQLTFSDDPLLNGINEVYQLIEHGDFSGAVALLDRLMELNPDYPGLIESYRASRFWKNREKDLKSLDDGKDTAEFLMAQWNIFHEYAEQKQMTASTAYRVAMRYVFFKASDHYKYAFREQQDTSNNFNFLLNLGDCFLRLEEYQSAVDTLEYAKNSYRSSARLLAILGEAYFHLGDVPRSLLHFREAFFVDPAEIDLDIIRAKPLVELVETVRAERPGVAAAEWVPVYGFIKDIFYVKRNINVHQLEGIKKDVYNLELTYQKMTADQLQSSSILPRLLNKYLWLLDYYEFQNYNFENIAQIRERLITLDRELFQQFFSNKYLKKP